MRAKHSLCGGGRGMEGRVVVGGMVDWVVAEWQGG